MQKRRKVSQHRFYVSLNLIQIFRFFSAGIIYEAAENRKTFSFSPSPLRSILRRSVYGLELCCRSETKLALWENYASNFNVERRVGSASLTFFPLEGSWHEFQLKKLWSCLDDAHVVSDGASWMASQKAFQAIRISINFHHRMLSPIQRSSRSGCLRTLSNEEQKHLRCLRSLRGSLSYPTGVSQNISPEGSDELQSNFTLKPDYQSETKLKRGAAPMAQKVRVNNYELSSCNSTRWDMNKSNRKKCS